MSSLLAETQAALLARLAHLPPSENPYLVVNAFLRDQLFPKVPDSAIYQLYALAGLLGVCGLNILVSLVWRARKGAFWLFSLQQTPRLIRPHVVVAWSSIALLMIVFLEVFIVLVIRFLHQTYYAGFAYFFFTVWFFAFWGGETAAWSLGVSYIVHRRATSAKPHTWQVHAANILGPLVPSVYTVVLLVLAIPGGRHYAQAIDVARQVENELLQRAASWREGQPFSVLSLAWAMPLLQKEAAFFTDFLESFRAVYTFYAVSAAVLVASLVSIAGVYFSAIRAGLMATRAPARRDGAGVDQHTVPNPQQRRIQRTLLNLRLTIILFTSVGVLFIVDAALATSSPVSFVRSPLRAQILILLPLYTFAVLGLPCSILLLHASYTVTPADTSSADRSGGQSSHSGPKHHPSHSRSNTSVTTSPRRSRPGSDELNSLAIQLESFGSFPGRFGEFKPGKKGWKAASRDQAAGQAHQASAISVKVDVDVMIDEDVDFDEKREAWPRAAV